jgi:high affinity Mn2+ porin
MKRSLTGILAATATAAVMASAGVAQADGMPRAAAAASYEMPALWSGGYVGVESGWDIEDHSGRFSSSSIAWSGSRNELAAGLYLGYQRQYGNTVVGLEVNIIGTENDHPAAGSCGSSLQCTGRMENIFTIGPRLGMSMGNWMPYVTGGWANGGLSFRTLTTTGSTSGAAVDESYDRRDGWFVGGGAEWKLAPYAVAGIDYKHIDLGSYATTAFSATSPGTLTNAMSQSATADQIMLRMHLLFGSGGYEAAPLK